MPASVTFLGASFHDPIGIGSVKPSGRRLVEALTAPVLERARSPINVLEVGAGTGPVTRALIEMLGPGSHLDVVEAHHPFLPRLRALARNSAGCTFDVHGCRVEDFEVPRRYDVIISSLPFTNMEPSHVDGLLEHYLNLSNPGAAITWFAYRGTRQARRLTASRSDVVRHSAVEGVLAERGGSRRTIWANVPPAEVTRIQVPIDIASNDARRVTGRTAPRTSSLPGEHT